MAEANWYLAIDGATAAAGPFSKAELKEGVTSGRIPSSARVAKAGTQDWVAVASVVGESGAARQTTTEQKQSRTVLHASVVIGAIIALEIGGFATWGVLDQRKFEAARKSEREAERVAEAERREKDQARLLGELVEISKVTTRSYATNTLVTLYFTNFSKETLIVCAQGVILQKESAGVRLYSMPICSGPVPSLETREVSAPWDGGRPSDLCQDRRGYLDWDKCDFKVIDFRENKK